MELKISNIKDNQLVWEKLMQFDKEDYRLREKICQAVLSNVFLHAATTLITIQPQKYSLGYELARPRELKVGKRILLINEMKDCDSELLETAVKSEEFQRTLLIIVCHPGELDLGIMQDILSLIDQPFHTFSTLAATVIGYCEDDGRSLYLHNSSLSLDELDILADIFA